MPESILSRPHHFVVIADVGHVATYHVGDEAMLDANLARLRQLVPHATFTVVSRDPEWTAQQYSVQSIAPMGFSRESNADGDRRALLDEILRNAEAFQRGATLASGSPGRAAIEAVAASNGVIVSGGGNMCSTWPDHLYERAALIRLAHLFQNPAIVLGQTIGPSLTSSERQLLAETLPLASLVGVRERASAALARELGVGPGRIEYQLDDTFFLESQLVTGERLLAELAALKRPWIAVTLHPFFDPATESALLTALAGQLDRIAQATGASLVYVPHVADGPTMSDAEVGRRIRALLGPSTPMLVLDVLPGRQTRELTAKAAMVISTRYHPLVFAASTGVPGLGVYTDDYTRVKLQGALEHAGLEDWSMAVDLALAGTLETAALELWRVRAEVGAHLLASRPRWREMDRHHWAYVAAALDVPAVPSVDAAEIRDESAGESVPHPSGAWAQVVRAFDSRRRQQTGKQQHLALQSDEATRYARAMESALQARDAEMNSLKLVLAARNEELAAVKFVLRARDEELASIKLVLAARNEELAAVKFVLRAHEEELANTTAALRAREDKLASIKALGVHAMPGPVICTIVCKNYLAHARCLAQSFLAHHPDGRVFVALADRVDGYFDPAAEPFTVVEAHELNIPDFDQMAFRYTLVEFNTAVKPFFLEYLFNQYDLPSVCYFDPDIYFYQPITLIEDLLTKHSAVLVPHITEPIDDERLPDEPFILRAGVYNLGFIGLSRRPEMYGLLHWWQKKLLKDCVVDTARGLFVDQRWMDLAPGLFEGIAILRDPGFDVAYWNLNGRRVRYDGDQWLVNNQPLVFYHFSGLMLSDLNAISKHQNRYTLRNLPDLKPLFEHYLERLDANDFRTVSGWPYAYGRFDNGVPIPDMARHLWRGLNGETRWPQPFIVEGTDSFFNWLNRGVDGGRPLVTNLAMELYRQRRDLQQSFPDVLGMHREGYACWFVESAENYAHFDVAFAQPVAESLLAASETPTLRLRVDALYRTLVLRPPIVPLLGRPTWYRQAYCAVRNPLRRLGLHRALKRLLGRSLVEKIDRRILFGHRVSVEDILRSASAPPAHDVFSTSHDAGSPQPAAPPHGLNVVGYLRTETGVGEVARSILRALAALDFPTAQTDLSNPEWARADDDSVTHLPAGHPYDYNLLCVNADMLQLTANQLGSRFFAGKYNIGFWHWETTHFPRKWFDRFAHLNEIWVDSGFMQKHLADVSPIPVVNVGLPVNGLVSSGVSRGDIGLPEDRFLFLFSFDARSYIQRKNPHGLIEAYRRAFGSAFDQTMPIIKATNLDEFPQEAAALRADVESVGGRLIARYMDRQELSGLFMACDAYVSLHRSEGFGLTIAEAMALGKPVIATAYSGNMEFMTPSNSYLVGYRLTIIDGDYGPYRCGGEWADPDLDHAAELMRLVFADRAGAAAKGAQAAADMRRDFGNAAVGRRIIARLERIRQERNGH